MFSIQKSSQMPHIKNNVPQQQNYPGRSPLRPLDKDVVSFSSVNQQRAQNGNNPLDKYTKGNTAISDELVAYRELDVLTFKNFFGSDSSYCGWKMHIYANTEQDMYDLQNSVGQYLIDKDVTWKTTIDYPRLQNLAQDKQKGKAITIYPKSIEDFKQIAKDIDYIIKRNKLQTQNTKIEGDRQLGDSGRIFYRFDCNSGKWNGIIFDLDKEGKNFKNNIYEKNRGDKAYLPHDMTESDDPFYNLHLNELSDDPKNKYCGNTINEKDKIAQFSEYFPGIRVDGRMVSKLEECPIEGGKYRLQKNKIYPLNSNIITLVECGNRQYDCRINLLKCETMKHMKDGDVITIGRGEDSDIIVGENNKFVSRCHVKIYKENGEFYIEDTSTNGTRVDKHFMC